MSTNQWFILTIILTNISIILLANSVVKIDHILKGHIISDFIKEYEKQEREKNDR